LYQSARLYDVTAQNTVMFAITKKLNSEQNVVIFTDKINFHKIQHIFKLQLLFRLFFLSMAHRTVSTIGGVAVILMSANVVKIPMQGNISYVCSKADYTFVFDPSLCQNTECIWRRGTYVR
jgi:hypothetical protein